MASSSSSSLSPPPYPNVDSMSCLRWSRIILRRLPAPSPTRLSSNAGILTIGYSLANMSPLLNASKIKYLVTDAMMQVIQTSTF